METVNLINNFTSGEVSSRLDARVDLDRYKTGCKVLENMIVHPHGGATRRYGTRYVAEVKTPSKRTRLIPFEYSVEQAYIIELGDQYMRFYKDSGQIMGKEVEVANPGFETAGGGGADVFASWVETVSDGAIAQDSTYVYEGSYSCKLTAGPSVDTEVKSAFITATPGTDMQLRFYTRGDGSYMGRFALRDVSNMTWIITSTNTDVTGVFYEQVIKDFTVPATCTQIQIFFYCPSTNGGIAYFDKVHLKNMDEPYELSTSYLEADLFNIKFAQTANTMYLVHENYKPQKLTREDHNLWVIVACDFWDGPYLKEDSSGTTITPGAATGSITLTASIPLFTSADLGRIMAIKHTSAYGWGVITAVASATSATMLVKDDLDGSGSAAVAWKWGAWGGAQGWPRAVAFYEQRLILAATLEQPQTIWGSSNVAASEQGYENYTLGTNDDDSWEYPLAADEVNVIQWMRAARYLFVGTHGGEWIVSSGSDDLAITPSQVKVRRETTHGCSPVQGIQIGHAILFVTRTERKVRQIAYSYANDSFEAEEISILSSHLMRNAGIVEWAHQEEPDSILWAVREDGALLGFTYERQHKVFAWHYHSTYGGEDFVESIASIPEDEHDQVWMVVQRYINGSWTRYVEFFEKDWGLYQEDAFYVDSGLTFYNPSTITNVTKANPGVVTAAGHGLSNGDKIYVTGVVGMTELNGHKYLVDDVTDDTFELQDLNGVDLNTSGYGTYSSGGLVEQVVQLISGLDHLEGRDVSILADGAIQPDETVSSGSITIDREAVKVHAGLRYTSILEPMRLESTVLGTTAQGRTKRIHEAVVRFYETISARMGRDEDTLETIQFRKTTDPMGVPITPYTGDKVITFPGTYDMNAYVRAQNSEPTPMTILAVIAKLNVEAD